MGLSELLKMQIELTNPCHVFNEPSKAIEFLEQYKVSPILKKYLSSDEDSDASLNSHLKIDIAGIQNTSDDPKRFSEISVAVIDYHMPGMNGVEVCQKIREKFPSIKIMMLTAEADNEVAIQAHNNKIIDLFVRKDKKDSVEHVSQMLLDLQRDYFREQTSILTESFLHNSEGYPEFFNDATFAKFFFNEMQNRHIREFYIINGFGDFVLIDQKGHKSWLMVRTKGQLRFSYEIAQYVADDQQDTELGNIAKQIERGEIAPFFKEQIITDTAPNEWQPYLHQLQKIEGEQTYFYTFINQ